MKTLVTHINPHLDDISAIWLFLRFHPDFKDAKIEFLSQSKTDELKDQETDDRIFLGIGKGQFDEHKGDKEDCATSLVWKYLKIEKIFSGDEILEKAVDELVEWSRIVDLGRLPEYEYGDFIVPAFIRPSDSTYEGSLKATELGCEILDRILKVLKEKQQSIKDWKNRVEFETKFGKSYAIKSETINRPFCKSKGGELFLMYDPVKKFAQFFTPSFEIDLEPIYQKVIEKEPDSGWFLHQSHHMVICGSGSTPDSMGTKISFEELIEIAKSA